MKKSNFHITLSIALLWTFACATLSAQTNVNMAANGTPAGNPFSIAPPATCFFNFYDFGGPVLPYNNSADASITFLPSNPATHRIQISFLAFGLEEGFDAFYIFNSNTVGVNQVPGPQGPTFTGFPGGNWQIISPGTVTANTGIANVGANAAEALTFRFLSDASVQKAGWAAIVRQLPKINCTMTAPNAMSVNTGLGASSCFANVTTPLPTFSPGGCQAGYTLQYRINGGLPTIVLDPINTTISAPVGSNVVTWELIDPCGGGVITSAVQMITVADNTLPSINCPGNVTLSLPPGDCFTNNYTFQVSCFDNCLFNKNGQVDHPIDFNNGQAGIMFDLVNLSGNTMTITQFGPSLDAGTWPMEVYYTTNPGSFSGLENSPGAWTLAGTQIVMSTTPAAGTAIPGFGITIPPGQTRGIYLTSSAGVPINYTETTRQLTDGVLRVSSNPGAGKAYPFGLTFAGRSFNGYVRYSVPTTDAAVQLAGIPSGEPYPIGTTTNIFRCTDAAGNTATCSFTVTVQDFPNAINSLVCNDIVNIALGPDCTHKIGADEVLEGGPYKCFDIYIVELDKTPPLGNGPWVPGILGPTDVGKTYRVRVTDPENGNRCSTDIKVLDNLAPPIDCTPNPITLPCNFPLDPTFSQTTTMTLPFVMQGLPQQIVDLETKEFSIPVNLPMNAIVQDVDVRVKISGDAFFNNLRIQAISPSSTIVTLWDQLGGCAPAPIWARFDDEGSPTLSCANYSTNQNAQIPFGFGVLSSFDGEDVNGNWKIRVRDMDGNGDVSLIESVEFYITMTGSFGAGFPNGLTAPPLTQNGFQSFNVPAGLLDPCSNVTLTYTDVVQNQNCTTGLTSIVTRRWKATDVSGNMATCNQTIKLLRPTFNDVVVPPDFNGINAPVFECDGEYPSPEWIENQGLQGWPTVFGFTTACGALNWDYTDVIAWVCDGSYNINRKWDIVDVCTGQVMTKTQLIRIQDQSGPVFIDCPADQVETTDPYECCSSMQLPDVLLEDQCSRLNNISALIVTIDPNTGDTIGYIPVQGGLFNFPGNVPSNSDTLGSFQPTPCIPIGEHIVVYTAQDACGNTATCSFKLTVTDYSPPVAACDETTIVAIGKDDPNDCYYLNQATCEFAGVTWVHAATFDDGSYDNCSNIKFSIRRAQPYSDCINNLNPCEKITATAESDSIKFYCCEVGTELKVILRVYQIDPDGSISLYPDGTPIYNECEVMVQVQDKLKPICESPLNVTVDCENFDPSLWAYGIPQVYDNCCLDTTKHYQGQKGLTHSVSYANFDSVCNKGTILRTFRVYDCNGATAQCTQRIVVTYQQDYFIKFPDDVIITQCDGTGMYGEPQFFGEDCELLAVSYQDQIYTVVPDACFKIERTWKIINWCTYNPGTACTVVPNPTPHTNTNHVSNLPGPIVSPAGTLAPWAPSVVKVVPTDPTATNYSIYWSPTSNCYEYKQIIKIIDQQAPIIACPPSPIEICDLSSNDPQLWNESYWWDATSQQHDLCEAPVDLNITATDFCSGSNLSIRYLLFLDTDGEGTMETVISSTNPPAAGTVNFNNVNTANFTGGTPRQFDHRAVAANQKYRFALQTTVNGTSMAASVRWNTPAQPGIYAVPELPYGTHKIKWIVSDGCGNEAVCEYQFVIKDCKAPTVTCLNGLSGNLMQTGLINLFASDFLLNAFDNCTPDDQLQFAIRKCGQGQGFPLDDNGNPNIGLTFDCDEIGTQCVELWAIDGHGNADFCETYIIVQDNGHNCGATSATVAGLLKTENSEGLEETDVELSGPTINLFDLTDQTGQYAFSNAVPMHADYVITPTKDDNPLNGVTTYDLVLISKHILGSEPLNTPYKMIAADANRSGSITTFDIVEIRKLILGVYTDIPGNDSWRFVDKEFAFPNVNNPFQTTFPESKTLAGIQANTMEEDFVAIKVGDVNGTAVANSLMSSEDRSEGVLLFDVEDKTVKAGEIFEVKFKASEKVEGYQFTMTFEDLDLVDVTPGPGMKSDNFATFADRNAITTSFNGAQQGEFTLKFKAKKAGELNKMIGISSGITKAEAYTANAAGATLNAGTSKLDVAFRFNGKEGSTISGVGFELYQNQPNPFVNRTMVGFHLPEAAAATLSVFDQSGRLVYRQKGDFPKGYNSIQLEKAILNTTGVLYYTLETDTHSATKTMIQAK